MGESWLGLAPESWFGNWRVTKPSLLRISCRIELNVGGFIELFLSVFGEPLELESKRRVAGAPSLLRSRLRGLFARCVSDHAALILSR